MNSAIEIHDSYLTSISKEGDALAVHLSAYIHKSDGKPATDAGTGWTQDVMLVVGHGSVEGSVSDWPAELYDGTLKIDGDVSENIISIPLDRKGAIELTLKPTSDDPLVVRGDSVRLELQGIPEYVEKFPGMTKA